MLPVLLLVFGAHVRKAKALRKLRVRVYACVCGVGVQGQRVGAKPDTGLAKAPQGCHAACAMLLAWY